MSKKEKSAIRVFVEMHQRSPDKKMHFTNRLWGHREILEGLVRAQKRNWSNATTAPHIKEKNWMIKAGRAKVRFFANATRKVRRQITPKQSGGRMADLKGTEVGK